MNIEMLESFQQVLFSNSKEKVLYGGSSSGKTYAAQQYALLKAMEEPSDESLIIMETQTDVLVAMFNPMCQMLDEWHIPYIPHESVPTSIELFNGHKLWFSPIFRSKGPQSSEAFKKYNNVKRIVLNEATALQWEDYLQLKNRMGRTKAAEILFTFNPIDEFHWLVQQYVNPFLENKLPDNIAVHHSTHWDNPFLTEDKHREYEDLIKIDQNYYRVYCLGLPGHLEGLIFKEGMNWSRTTVNEWPQDIQTATPKSIGIDFGYNDPVAIVAVWEAREQRYCHCVLYQSSMTQSDLLQFLETTFIRTHWPRSLVLYCDSAEPARIEDLRRHGFNAAPAHKDIAFGIDAIKQKPLVVSDESPDFIKELRNYRWMEKDGMTIDKPVDKFNHAIDACRYAIASLAVQLPPLHVFVRPKQNYQSPYAMRTIY